MSQSPSNNKDQADLQAYARAWQEIGNRVISGRAWSGHERHKLFLNAGAGRFADASFVGGFDLQEDGRGMAWTDWDHDGDLDLWITSRSAPRARLLVNRSAEVKGGRFLGVRLRGRDANRDGIGARVTVLRDDGVSTSATVRAGEGFLSQSSKQLVFGLGDAKPQVVSVRWPGGKVERFSGVSSGGHYTLAQGTGAAAPSRLQPRLLKTSATPLKPRKLGPIAAFVQRPVPSPPLVYTDLQGKTQPGPGPGGAATLLVLWSRWCQPCMAELEELAKKRAELAQAGLQVLALNVDRLSTTKGVGEPVEVTEKALAAQLAKTAPGISAGTLEDKQMAKVEMLLRMLFTWRAPLALPTSLLIDQRGMLRGVYRGKASPQTVLGHLKAVREGPGAWQRAAAAGQGFFAAPLPAPRYFAIGRFFVQHGHPDAALRYFEAAIAQDEGDADAQNMVGALMARSGNVDKALVHFEAAVKAKPGHGEALSNLAAARLQRGEVDAALGLLKRAVEAAPKNPVLRHRYGMTLANAGKLQEAKAQLLKVKELDPNAPVGPALKRLEADLAKRAGGKGR